MILYDDNGRLSEAAEDRMDSIESRYKALGKMDKELVFYRIYQAIGLGMEVLFEVTEQFSDETGTKIVIALEHMLDVIESD